MPELSKKMNENSWLSSSVSFFSTIRKHAQSFTHMNGLINIKAPCMPNWLPELGPGLWCICRDEQRQTVQIPLAGLKSVICALEPSEKEMLYRIFQGEKKRPFSTPVILKKADPVGQLASLAFAVSVLDCSCITDKERNPRVWQQNKS